MVYRLARLGARFAAAGMHEYEDANENWRLCLNHILSARIEAWRAGTRATVGEVLYDLYTKEPGADGGLTYFDARKLLMQAGLALTQPTRKMPMYELFVPNQDPLLQSLFMGTK